MLISCNKLKSHIKDSHDIDWLKIWDTFTIRTAEVEGVTVKGQDLKDVVVAEIIECEPHPTKEKYHILKVSDGKEIYDILCGAPNVRVGLKAPLVKVGGMVSGFTITEKKIAGVVSQGMLCAGDELGINDDHDGILEFPSDTVVGTDIKDILPVEDIIVEIDNKSLTNRPDLWGHYGIAREIAAITEHELLPLELAEVTNDKEDLKIEIKDKDLCYRYCGITIDNITNNKTPLEMQIFLHYTGVRSISLIVDLTNYLLLELGQPMHSFDKEYVKEIVVEKANDKDIFVTLDGETRNLTSEMLMIKNGKEYSAVAGVMGGLDSEITDKTNSVFLESATFNAASIRKTATALGLRTEASARYEKSLDPNYADIAIKRYIKLLKDNDEGIEVSSNLTDVYPTVLEEGHITLSKELLTKYLGFNLEEERVVKILTSLDFKVTVTDDAYEVVVPTYRATKDVTLPADIIEEIARIYGYENFAIEPLKLDLTFEEHENIFTKEYNVKKYLSTKYYLSEVHSYMWYETSLLKTLELEKDNVKLVGKNENNILRDNLSLSLLHIVKENLKHESNAFVYEIGTVIVNNENERHLGIVLADNENNLENTYYKAKEIIVNLFKEFKNSSCEFIKNENAELSELAYDINVNNEVIGTLSILSSKATSKIGKKKAIVLVEINFDKYCEMEKNTLIYKPLSKYPFTTLDYTIIMSKDNNYETIKEVVESFENEYIIDYKLVGKFELENETKYTIRFTVGSYEKTLATEDLQQFKDSFISLIKEKGLNIIE
ncbi:MAG: phenylalanine--tRNA ligase subunit beta [Bacilli bacterium]|nr:phenylalanine--tRNA ligase subunit beta [Bacilli bacterium]